MYNNKTKHLNKADTTSWSTVSSVQFFGLCFFDRINVFFRTDDLEIKSPSNSSTGIFSTISLWTFIKATASRKRYWDIRDLKYVFNLLRPENDLSAVQLDTGEVNTILSSFFISGMILQNAFSSLR